VTWITSATFAALVGGIVVVIEGHLVSKRMPSLKALLFPEAIVQLVLGLSIIAIHPLSREIGSTSILVAIASGVARSIAIFLMIRALRSEEVSRVIPVVHTFPIFVAILAVPLLSETLGYLEWVSIILTVAGAVLISIKYDTGGRGARLRKSFAMLMGSSLLIGIANTASKYALEYISFWNMCSINAICISAVFILLSLRPGTLLELRNMKKRGKALALVTLGGCLALTTNIFSFWAMEQGPVSLVSAILNIRPSLVFIYALALSHFFPDVLNEQLSRGTIVIKLVSIGLIIGGVTLLTLVS